MVLEEVKEDHSVAQITEIPKCVGTCVYNRVFNDCAYTDYWCICTQLEVVLFDERFKSCVQGCDYNSEQIRAAAAMRSFCDSAGVPLDNFPSWITPLGLLDRRQVRLRSDFSSAYQTIFTTSTSTAPWGQKEGLPRTATLDEIKGTVSVIVEVENTVASVMKLITSTLPGGQAPYTSTFTNSGMPEVTVIIGVTATASGSNPTGVNSDTSSTKKSGLSTGAKVGIGVTIPLLIIIAAVLLGIWWHRKRNKEYDDGGLPEHINTLSEMQEASPRPPPAYLKSPSSVYEISADELQHPAAAAIRHEMATYSKRELSQSPLHLHEIGSAEPSPAMPGKPVSPSSLASNGNMGPSIPPWDNFHENEVSIHQAARDEPVRTTEDIEIQRMEEEMAQVRLRKERLANLERLEQREAELERAIVDRKRGGSTLRLRPRVLSTFLLPFLAAASGSLDCAHLRKDNIGFDLSKLGGARSVVHNVDHGGISSTNTTYTIDICRPLGKVKNVPSDRQCPNGTRLCAITRAITKEQDIIEEVVPIAGELADRGGGALDAKWERLKASKANADIDKEGLRVEIHGGFKTENGKKRPQKAIIEFICDKERTGLENLPSPEDQYDEAKDKREEAAADDKTTPSLQFVGYALGDDLDVLRLNWRTQYACEDSKKEQDQENGQHWGFFTWFIIVAFLSTATYLIFGSWLNYNRYGARGWDLLPHGDTIRDVPYLFKDWVRRVVNTVQGPGSRGGYAAV
ncbi:autophagy-related protein 27-domain-containing protein [Bisporella sp. PMI_857]|nr:autophagy-related protein 27-domain-containing protein [Bisporella sp. PMI_857]KAH8600570.1 autophagy-related protein 27-domain-containing protein [Bisporella sp. PMI_857]